MLDYYEILGLSINATDDAIKKAFRNLALQYHPDKNSAPDAEAKFKEINQAYSTLSDPSKAKAYREKYLKKERSSAFKQNKDDLIVIISDDNLEQDPDNKANLTSSLVPIKKVNLSQSVKKADLSQQELFSFCLSNESLALALWKDNYLSNKLNNLQKLSLLNQHKTFRNQLISDKFLLQWFIKINQNWDKIYDWQLFIDTLDELLLNREKFSTAVLDKVEKLQEIWEDKVKDKFDLNLAVSYNSPEVSELCLSLEELAASIPSLHLVKIAAIDCLLVDQSFTEQVLFSSDSYWDPLRESLMERRKISILLKKFPSLVGQALLHPGFHRLLSNKELLALVEENKSTNPVPIESQVHKRIEAYRCLIQGVQDKYQFSQDELQSLIQQLILDHDLFAMALNCEDIAIAVSKILVENLSAAQLATLAQKYKKIALECLSQPEMLNKLSTSNFLKPFKQHILNLAKNDLTVIPNIFEYAGADKLHLDFIELYELYQIYPEKEQLKQILNKKSVVILNDFLELLQLQELVVNNNQLNSGEVNLLITRLKKTEDLWLLAKKNVGLAIRILAVLTPDDIPTQVLIDFIFKHSSNNDFILKIINSQPLLDKINKDDLKRAAHFSLLLFLYLVQERPDFLSEVEIETCYRHFEKVILPLIKLIEGIKIIRDNCRFFDYVLDVEETEYEPFFATIQILFAKYRDGNVQQKNAQQYEKKLNGRANIAKSKKDIADEQYAKMLKDPIFAQVVFRSWQDRISPISDKQAINLLLKYEDAALIALNNQNCFRFLSGRVLFDLCAKSSKIRDVVYKNEFHQKKLENYVSVKQLAELAILRIEKVKPGQDLASSSPSLNEAQSLYRQALALYRSGAWSMALYYVLQAIERGQHSVTTFIEEISQAVNKLTLREQAQANYYLWHIYRHEKASVFNLCKANAALKVAAAHGSEDAINYYTQQVIVGNESALTELKELYNLDTVTSKAMLAYAIASALAKPGGHFSDLQLAIRWFLKSLEENYFKAQEALKAIYQNEALLVDKGLLALSLANYHKNNGDNIEAFTWEKNAIRSYRIALAQGDIIAFEIIQMTVDKSELWQTNISDAYVIDTIQFIAKYYVSTKDNEQAIRWYLKLALISQASCVPAKDNAINSIEVLHANLEQSKQAEMAYKFAEHFNCASIFELASAWLFKAAQLGYSPAIERLKIINLTADPATRLKIARILQGIIKELTTAIDIYLSLAKLANGEALVALCAIYFDRMAAVDKAKLAYVIADTYKELKQYQTAISWYEAALMAGYYLSLEQLSKLIAFTDSKDTKKRISYAIAEGYSAANNPKPDHKQALLWYCRLIVLGERNLDARVESLCGKLAKEEQAWQAYLIAIAYENCHCPALAMSWDLKAAYLGHDASLVKLSQAYLAKPDAELAFQIANIYKKQKRDINLVVDWYSKAAQLGMSEALDALISFYNTGTVAELATLNLERKIAKGYLALGNQEKARLWYIYAVINGDREALFELDIKEQQANSVAWLSVAKGCSLKEQGALFNQLTSWLYTDPFNYKNFIKAWRKQALVQLMQEVVVLLEPKKQLLLLRNMKREALFNQHRQQYWWQGAWGRTQAVTEIDNKILKINLYHYRGLLLIAVTLLLATVAAGAGATLAAWGILPLVIGFSSSLLTAALLFAGISFLASVALAIIVYRLTAVKVSPVIPTKREEQMMSDLSVPEIPFIGSKSSPPLSAHYGHSVYPKPNSELRKTRQNISEILENKKA